MRYRIAMGGHILRRFVVVGFLVIAGLPLVRGLGVARPLSPTAGQRSGTEAHGWWCTAGGVSFPRPAAALVLTPGTTVHPEVAPMDLEVSFAGRLALPLDGRYRFGLEAEGGDAELLVSSVAGELARVTSATPPTLGEWVELPRGDVDVRVVFRRHGDAAARLRTLWELAPSPAGGIPLEPIPSFDVRLPADVPGSPSPAADRARGRALLAQKGCVGCHRPARPLPVARRFAPQLEGVAQRLAPSWIRKWIRAPHAVKVGADMPTLFPPAAEGRAADEAEVEALLHFLVQRGADADPAVPPPPASSADLERGRALYHSVGCVPCHGALEGPAIVHGDDELALAAPAAEVPNPFADLTGKWRPGALAVFLRDPLAARPDGRMPSLSLTADEAAAVGAYLEQHFGATPEEPFLVDPERAREGRRRYAARNCRACHDPLGLTLPEPVLPSLAQVAERPTGGCLDAADAVAPRYDLTPAERTSMRAALAGLGRLVDAAAPVEEVARTMDWLGCRACHVVDGRGGPPPELDPYFENPDPRVDLLDQGRFAPDLSGVGGRLTTRWLEAALLEGERARPYMHLRMPQYGAVHVGRLPAHFSWREGLAAGADVAPPPAGSAERQRTGRRLTTRAALGCVTCHVYREYPPAGTPGPAFSDFARRIQPEWFRSYLQNPQRYKRGSRMPDFGTGGVSSLDRVFDGDLTRQGEALWAYFALGEDMPPPEGLGPPVTEPFDPDRDGEPLAPPPGAVVLFDGTDLAAWSTLEGEEAGWRLVDGAMEVVPGSRDIVSRESFGDVLVHVEFRVPLMPTASGQGRGNSGVYLAARYEVQVLDSFGLEPGLGDAGAIYGKRIPDRNMCRRPERWQAYDIEFRAPRFDAAGEKVEHARMQVWHNGVLIHPDFAVDGTTTAGLPGPEAARGPLRLQDHGCAVRYRNVWVLPR